MSLEILSVMKRRTNLSLEQYLNELLIELKNGNVNIDINALMREGKSTMTYTNQKTGEYTIHQVTVKEVGSGGIKIDFKKSGLNT